MAKLWRHGRNLALWAVVLGTALGEGTRAQTPSGPVNGLDARRLTEIQVELAWLADPQTFPYFLEARVEGQTLEVRGYAPSMAVRHQACKLARLHCPLIVVDAMKEHSSLAARPVKVHPEHLQRTALTSLRLALPRYESLDVQSDGEGKITLTGSVRSLPEKLAASQALRRLHGCRFVCNQLTVVSGEARPVPTANAVAGRDANTPRPVTATSAKGNASRPATTANMGEPPLLTQALYQPEPLGTKTIQKVANVSSQPAQPKAAPFIPLPASKPAARKPTPAPEPLVAVKPAAVPSTPVTNTIVPTPFQATAKVEQRATETDLKRRLEKVVGRSVQVQLASPRELRVELPVRSEAEATQLADRIFALPELASYRLDLHLQVAP